MGRRVEMTGRVFGRLTVIEKTDRRSSSGDIFWRCQCECGNRAEVNGGALRRGESRSCGCLFLEVAAEKFRKLLTKHGKSGTSTHTVWMGMKQRCESPGASKFAIYGGRGIKVCDRWQSFSNFLADMGERPPGMSIDRIDPDGDYEPGNCRWATQLEQQNNRRNNRMVLVNGERMTVSMAARSAGLKPDMVMQRLKRGLSIEQALVSAPARPTTQLTLSTNEKN